EPHHLRALQPLQPLDVLLGPAHRHQLVSPGIRRARHSKPTPAGSRTTVWSAYLPAWSPASITTSAASSGTTLSPAERMSSRTSSCWKSASVRIASVATSTCTRQACSTGVPGETIEPPASVTGVPAHQSVASVNGPPAIAEKPLAIEAKALANTGRRVPGKARAAEHPSLDKLELLAVQSRAEQPTRTLGRDLV